MMEIVGIRHIHHVNVGIIDSPAFESPAPTVRHIDLIPKEVRNAMRGAWDTRLFPAHSISVDKVFDVFVTAEGLVFTKDDKLISETVTQHSPAEIERAFAHLKSLKDIREIETSCLLMRKRGDHNYGHWLIELLPKLAIARMSCHVHGLAIPNINGPIRSIIKDSLALADQKGGTARFEIAADEAVFFKELVIVSGATQHGSYMSPLMIAEINRISKNIAGRKTKRIFVSRRGAPRNLANQDAVERALRGIRFDIVHPGGLSFFEQISTFKDASTVVGVMGAGMTNIAFAQTGARILNLSPATMPDTFFYLISTHKKHDYREVRGRNVSSSNSWDEPFTIDVDELLKEIED